MGGRADDLRTPLQLRPGKAGDILPPVVRQPAGGVVEAVFGVRLFHVDLDGAVGVHFGMDDFGAVVQGEERIHHSGSPPFTMAFSRSC